jgi:uncharacterized protein (TIGR03067 family)
MKVTRVNDRWSLIRGGDESAFVDRINSFKLPKTVDITVTSDETKDHTFLGIYEIDGDVVRLCYARFGGTRPMTFSSEKGAGHTLIELRRFRTPSVEVVKSLPDWPVPGGQLRLVAKVADPEGGRCRIDYRVGMESPWVEVLGEAAGIALVTLEDIPAGRVEVTLRAVSDRGGPSPGVTRIVVVEAPKIAVPPEQTDVLVNAVGMKFVKISPGEFAMGSLSYDPTAGANEMPKHGVRISSHFYLGQHEVTNSEWAKVLGVPAMGEHPLYGLREDNEAWIEASPEKAQQFIESLNQNPAEMAAGRSYRLPTEEEWEYACRGGTTTLFWTGNSLDEAAERFGGSAGLSSVCPVGQGRANPFGLYDMHGNADELCVSRDDYWTSRAVAAAEQHSYVIRGGTEQAVANDCRSAKRAEARASDRSGLRVVCELGKPRVSIGVIAPAAGDNREAKVDITVLPKRTYSLDDDGRVLRKGQPGMQLRRNGQVKQGVPSFGECLRAIAEGVAALKALNGGQIPKGCKVRLALKSPDTELDISVNPDVVPALEKLSPASLSIAMRDPVTGESIRRLRDMVWLRAEMIDGLVTVTFQSKSDDHKGLMLSMYLKKQ